MSTHAPCLLTDGEAGRMLRMLPVRLKRLAKTGTVPHVLLPDGEIRFDPDALWQWIDGYRRGPRVTDDVDDE